MTDTPDATPTDASEPEDQTTAHPAKSSGRRGPTKTARKSTSRESSEAAGDAAGSLASILRGLVGGIDEEVTAITGLSAEIDVHVAALNELRAEATRRLLHLDDLRAAAEDVNLSAFLDASIQPQLPQAEEDFPDRIYGG